MMSQAKMLNTTYLPRVASVTSIAWSYQIHMSYCLTDIFIWLSLCHLKVNFFDLSSFPILSVAALSTPLLMPILVCFPFPSFPISTLKEFILVLLPRYISNCPMALSCINIITSIVKLHKQRLRKHVTVCLTVHRFYAEEFSFQVHYSFYDTLTLKEYL